MLNGSDVAKLSVAPSEQHQSLDDRPESGVAISKKHENPSAKSALVLQERLESPPPCYPENKLLKSRGVLKQGRAEELTAPVKFSQQQKSALKIDDKYIKSLNTAIREFEKSFQENNNWAHITIGLAEFVPALVEMENLKKPGLNLRYCKNPKIFGKEIAQCIADNTPYARFIVKRARWEHVAYFDYQFREGCPSILQVDSAPFSAIWASELGCDVRDQVRGLHPELRFSGLDLGVQVSDNGCQAFALNLAKQLYRHPEALEEAHQRNIKDELCPLDPKATPQKPWVRADKLIPPILMKHSQSSMRTKEYLAADSSSLLANAKINSKGDTLNSYQANHKATEGTRGHEKSLVSTIFIKRLDYLKELRDAIS